MPTPTTAEQFLELVRKAELLGPDALDAYVREHHPLPAEPRELARQMVRDGLLTEFQSRLLRHGKWRGFNLGKYRVLEHLGQGGMGAVYLCEHRTMCRRVAVKVLPRVRAGNDSALLRFYREARAAAAVDHPNLVRAHDLDREGDLHFLVMEYVDGPSLHELVTRSGPLDAPRAAHYVHQALLGLQHLHEAGLVHRDLKPANILIDRHGTVKILDLGLARFFHDHQDLITRELSSGIIGTADYLSPEQGVNSHTVDIRSDIYSLGCTFYFLLTGRAPFEGRAVTQKLLCHQLEAPEPIRSLRPEVPADLAAVVERMMAKDPAGRYQTPAEAGQALAPWTRTPAPPPREEEMPRRSPAARGSGLSDADPRSGPRPPASASGWPAPPSAQEVPVEAIAVLEPGRPVQQEPPPRERIAPTTDPAIPPADTQTRLPALTSPDRGPSLHKSRFSAWMLAGSAGLVLLATGIGAGMRWALSGPADRPTPPPPPLTFPAPGILQVEGGTGREQSFPTLREALAGARPGDRVVVRQEVLEEALSLAGRDAVGHGVTVEGGTASGKPPVWRPPAGLAAGQPLLDLSDVGGLRLRGFVLDGQGRVDELVVLSGKCPGLALEDLHLRGFCRGAIRMSACQGDERRPVSLLRVRTSDAAGPKASALLFWADPERVNRHVHVRDGRFEGPGEAGVQLAGSVAAVRVEGNRFFKVANGVTYRKVDPRQQLYLTLAANTFCEVGCGLRFAAVPPADHSHLEVRANLFSRTRRLASVENLRTQPANVRARWVWSDGGKDPAAPRAFRKTFQVPRGVKVTKATLDVVCDHSFTAWVNGVRVGQGQFNPNGRRVLAFDVARHLRPGKNVLAVEGVGRMRARRAGPAGLLVRLVAPVQGAAPLRVLSDRSWRVATGPPAGWQQIDFNDGKWAYVKFKSGAGLAASWNNLVWDSVVREQVPGGPRLTLLAAADNWRDGPSTEGFPPLGSRTRADLRGAQFNLPVNPADDTTFLRYPKTSFLSQAGPKKTPVGVPPAPGKPGP